MRSRNEGLVPAVLRAGTEAEQMPGELGMSFEVTEVVPADKRAKVWKLGKSHVYGRGDSEEGEGGVPGYVDQTVFIA